MGAGFMAGLVCVLVGNLTLTDHSSLFKPITLAHLFSVRWLVAYSPDGHFLAYGTESIADIYVWDIRSGTITTFEDNPNGFIKTVLFSPDGLLVLGTGGWLSTIFSWNMKSGKALPLITGRDHGMGIFKLAFDHTGTLLASAGFDKTIMIRNMKLNKLQMVSQELDDTFLSGVSFNHGGTLVACGGIDGIVHFLDVKSASVIMKVNVYTDYKPMNLLFNPTGTLLEPVMHFGICAQQWLKTVQWLTHSHLKSAKFAFFGLTMSYLDPL